MKPMPIAVIARRMTPARFVELNERYERERQANIRLAKITEDARVKAFLRQKEQEEIASLGRCEYLYLSNARRKEKLTQRFISNARAQQEFCADFARKVSEREAAKAAAVERRQRDLEEMLRLRENPPVNLEYLPRW